MAVIDYTNGEDNSTPIVLTDYSTVLQVTDGSATQSGVISDSGGPYLLQKWGAGTLILTADNTYTSPTQVDGVLQIGNGGTQGSITGEIDLFDTGQIVFDRSDTYLYAGNISYINGGGPYHSELVQAGTGTLILTGNAVPLGGTVITAGTLQIGNGGTAGSLTRAVVDNAALVFDRTDAVTFADAISGSGTLSQAGTGKLILTADNSYTGGTIIAAGTLQVGALETGITTGSLGSGAILDNGTLIFDHNSMSVANAISGTGNVTQSSTGVLTLAGLNTYIGVTTVNAGTLTVDGSIADSATTVNSGAALDGTGSVGSLSVLSGGKLNAGNSIGMLHVNGNLTMASGSTYAEDLSFSSADETIVSGTAGISGTLAENFSGGSYVAGETYTILSAAGGLSGTFSNVTATGLPAGFSAVVTYDSHNAYLTIQSSTAGGFSGPANNDIVWQSRGGQATMSQFSGGAFVTAPVIGGDPGPTWHIEGTGDFNGDGNTDILWENDSGAVVTWLMNGSTIASGATVGIAQPNWKIVGTGDFNGDGKSDILWQNTNGEIITWNMDGSVITSTPYFDTITSHFVGTGDFNGDGVSDVLWQDSNGQVRMSVSGPPGGAVSVGGSSGPGWRIVGTGDFNGDGKADILWQNANGQVVAWFMDGSTITSGAGIGSASNPTWNIVGTGDFNGDGKTDIAWQNTTGQAVVWFMNGSTIASGATIGNLGPEWQIVNNHPLTLPPKTRGSDFNGDGDGDILWHSDAGQVQVWLLNGATISNSAVIGSSSDTSWSIVGAGDFNGDGKTDILWQNTSGQVVTWQMNGTTVTSGTLIGSSADPSWQIKATGDFNGDGDSDILWQNSNGQAVIWFMNGATNTSGALIGNPGSTMHVAGTGDFDGDGKSDIVFQDDSGQTAIWLMNGSTATSSPVIGNPNLPNQWNGAPGSGWGLAGVGDFDGDGKSDLLWEQAGTRNLKIWFMNGTSITGEKSVDERVPPGPEWTIANVADINGDGHSDIIWQNTDGQAVAWLIGSSSATVTSTMSQPSIGSSQGTAWHIVNATT